jgi:hypothetical protein
MDQRFRTLADQQLHRALREHMLVVGVGEDAYSHESLGAAPLVS